MLPAVAFERIGREPSFLTNSITREGGVLRRLRECGFPDAVGRPFVRVLRRIVLKGLFARYNP